MIGIALDSRLATSFVLRVTRRRPWHRAWIINIVKSCTLFAYLATCSDWWLISHKTVDLLHCCFPQWLDIAHDLACILNNAQSCTMQLPACSNWLLTSYSMFGLLHRLYIHTENTLKVMQKIPYCPFEGPLTYRLHVSIMWPLGYGPSTLPLRQIDDMH